MKKYAVANGDETAYYSHGYENAENAQMSLEFALNHDPKAHIVEYEVVTLQERYEALKVELEQVKHERDAAVKDLEYAGSENGEFCSICKYSVPGECEIRKFYHNHCWEWRGVEVINDDDSKLRT